MQHPREPDRLLRQVRPLQLVPAAARVALVEDQVEDAQHAAQARRSVFRRRQRERHARIADQRLALEMRCAIVRSATRNALAISAVVSPPTARSVRAIAEAGVSAGWQLMKSTTSVSSSSLTSSPAESSLRAATLSRCAGTARCALVDQPPRRRLDQPAARLLRNAVTRPAQSRGEQRLLDGVLGRVEIAEPANQRAEDLRRELAQQVLDAARHVQRGPSAVWRYASISAASAGASSMT